MIHKITRIEGAFDVEYKSGRRIWIPPNNKRAYFTQLPYSAANRSKYLPRNLTDEQHGELLLDIKLHLLAKEKTSL